MSTANSAVFFLLTDFGPESIYTGQLRGILKRICPASDIHTLSNTVPRQDPIAAAFYLRSSFPHLPNKAGILSVVDPGVGTDRPIVAVRTRRPEMTLVGPDNGTFSVLESRLEACHRVTNEELWLDQVSNTFHGRDVMAPTLAHLFTDTSLEEVGPEQTQLRPLDPPDIFEPDVHPELIRGQILFADSFGNLISNISMSDLEQAFDNEALKELQIRTQRLEIQGLSDSYDEVNKGTPIALIGSANQLEISINQDSAREVLDLEAGDRVNVQL